MIDANTTVVVCSVIWAVTAVMSFIKDDLIVKRNYKILTEDIEKKAEQIKILYLP